MHFHIWSIMSLLVVFPSFSSLEEEFPVRSARTPVRCSRELEDLRQQKCLKTDRRMDRPYCTAHRLLSACLSALPWGQAPNCWSWRNSVSLVGSHTDGVLFLAPSSNPCLILNKCLNSSSEHGPHPDPPSSAHPQPMWYRHASVCNALSLYNGAYVMELPQPPSSHSFIAFSLVLGSLFFISVLHFCHVHSTLYHAHRPLQWVPQIMFTLNESSDFWRMHNSLFLVEFHYKCWND